MFLLIYYVDSMLLYCCKAICHLSFSKKNSFGGTSINHAGSFINAAKLIGKKARHIYHNKVYYQVIDKLIYYF